MQGPNPNAVHPNESIPSVCYIKNTITRKNIIVGDYTYYDDPVNPEDFQSHVTHHYDFIGDRLRCFKEHSGIQRCRRKPLPRCQNAL